MSLLYYKIIMKIPQPSESESQPEGFEVTETPPAFTLHTPEFTGSGPRKSVAGWTPRLFRGIPSEEHPDHVEYEEVTGDGEDSEEPAKLYKRIGTYINPDNLIPDIVKGDSGRRVLKYIGAISAAVVLEETARRSVRAIRKRNS